MSVTIEREESIGSIFLVSSGAGKWTIEVSGLFSRTYGSFDDENKAKNVYREMSLSLRRGVMSNVHVAFQAALEKYD